MQPGKDLTFGPFRLDVAQGQLWRGAQVLALRRRSLAMLRYLAEHPGRLVTKAELRQHVWAGTHITDTVLRVCVQEIGSVPYSMRADDSWLWNRLLQYLLVGVVPRSIL